MYYVLLVEIPDDARSLVDPLLQMMGFTVQGQFDPESEFVVAELPTDFVFVTREIR